MDIRRCNRVLVAFDFDFTIVDSCCDKFVERLLPEGETLPESIRQLHSPRTFVDYVSASFRYLRNKGIKPKNLLDCVAEIRFVEGLKQLITWLKSQVDTDIIIISDGNSVFIEHVLRTAGLRDAFQAIYTNPAYFDSNGCLIVQPYQKQTSCSLSTQDLCKGDVLDNHRRLRPDDEGYDAVIYIGDGSNDLCPALRLKATDMIFARRGYRLDEAVRTRTTSEADDAVNAEVILWDTGYDIMSAIHDRQLIQTVADTNTAQHKRWKDVCREP